MRPNNTYAAVFAIVLAYVIPNATAESLYLQGDLGLDYYPPNDLDGEGFDIGPGLSLGARIGKSFSFVRGEIEGGLALATIDLEIDDGEEDVDYYQFSITVGAYTDVGPAYIGAGAGLVQQEVETRILGVTISDSDTNFIVHGEAGFAFDLTGSVELVPHYRATWLPGFDLDDEVIVHSAKLGIRFGI